MSINYGLIFLTLMPGSVWSCAGSIDVYENYTWAGPGEQPSKEVCDEAWSQIESDLSRGRIEKQRQAAYQVEADPLYFGWMRGESTEQVWLDKVAEIRARYPYPA